ncbi:alpha/beta fold hydrolase [Phenylobacterium montanum]|uniref:Alpha/beta hydrolase n=1 Tax=Phenylobacterium montanum TaxID=2823693 RepID=A0A975IU62_9CAUL|nr:alpha/beta hydrolase [Caulobacter sp. S6]QUD87468.1 alpha/beta hydrolase [Caulobacter sp. S6]
MLAGAELTKVEVDGVQIAVERIGHGAPVVCLTAVGHDARDFDPLAQRCPDGFEFIRIEWPSHGRSGPDHEPVDPGRYAELLAGVLGVLGVSRPVLIGNSIGGATAVRYAAALPVRGLVLCDSGGLVAVDATARRFCGLVEAFFAAGERGAAWFRAAYALYYRLVLPTRAAAAHRREIVRNGPRLAPQLRQAWASFARPEADIRDLAANLDIPIWVAWAKSDRVIPLSFCRPAIDRLKRASLTVFPGGHSPFLEQPDSFAKGFRAFAAGLGD